MDLKRSVALITLKLYNKNIARATPNVKPTACIIKPGYDSAKAAFMMAEIAPMNKPSNKAYKGAKNGAQLGLKVIANAEIKPPIIPTHIKVVMVSCFSCSYKFQLYAAPAINISIMNPNLLIDPL